MVDALPERFILLGRFLIDYRQRKTEADKTKGFIGFGRACRH
jgi:hypothetical protein